MDEFSVKVIITSPWKNETWEWLGGVTTEQAEAVYQLLGKPDFVHLHPVASTHGGIDEH